MQQPNIRVARFFTFNNKEWRSPFAFNFGKPTQTKTTPTWRHAFASSVPAFFTWPSFSGQICIMKNEKTRFWFVNPSLEMTIAVTVLGQASFITLFCLFAHVYHSFAHDKNASYTMYERLSLDKKGSVLHFDHGLCKQRRGKDKSQLHVYVIMTPSFF